ncbi:hypothetical protein TPY_3197 [Sulfobacillus acidophilus TPY]|uniref:Uncharacterized protein n=1 Tax=Sulfobacillus acidophilus (strain ATCC 700253 / DSM 10332 / NAL) TaxID=679936 RepID=G8TZH2_SULAD|nr:hypothetical protein TPY_3197 [Sulfobacillus acidophilus TPY]AEW05212.1 hypothetical protein Sulac_1716 [Sulfobacillus acidophilus DSM 10332]
MSDIVVLLIAVIVLLWLLHSVFSGSASTASPYQGSSIGTSGIVAAVDAGIKAIDQTASSASKELGSLAVKVERNAITGAAKAASHSPVAVPSQKSYNAAVGDQLYPGISLGSAAAGLVGGVTGGAVGAIIPTTIGGTIQGAVSGVESVGKLPGVKTVGKFLGTQARDLSHWVGSQAHDFTNWVGHLL